MKLPLNPGYCAALQGQGCLLHDALLNRHTHFWHQKAIKDGQSGEDKNLEGHSSIDLNHVVQ